MFSEVIDIVSFNDFLENHVGLVVAVVILVAMIAVAAAMIKAQYDLRRLRILEWIRRFINKLKS
ncbi:hypothetical protein AB0Y04_00475 [Loigolactobacillus coryniformis]|uniref:hypothetical protein n=1 Tax=Loigolactobacillus coryniformis TaxID=1610 RepID=UPI003F262E53